MINRLHHQPLRPKGHRSLSRQQAINNRLLHCISGHAIDCIVADHLPRGAVGSLAVVYIFHLGRWHHAHNGSGQAVAQAHKDALYAVVAVLVPQSLCLPLWYGLFAYCAGRLRTAYPPVWLVGYFFGLCSLFIARGWLLRGSAVLA